MDPTRVRARRRAREGWSRSLVDVASLVLMFPLALFARFDFRVPDDSRWSEWPTGLLIMIAVAVVLQLVVGRVTGLYSGRWLYGSLEELGALGLTAAVLTLVLVPMDVMLISDRRLIPLGSVVGALAASLVLMTFVRYFFRIRHDRRRRREESDRRALIAGGGAAGTLSARELLRNPQYGWIPVGFLDDDPTKHNLRPAGIKVLGATAEMGAIAERVQADALIIAVPSAPPETVERLAGLAGECGLEIKIVPHVLAVLNETVHLRDIREIKIEDLLDRDVVSSDVEGVAAYLKGKGVLVTGAGGSIGSELARQIQSLDPRQVVLLDHDETNLLYLEADLHRRGPAAPEVVVADIRDQKRIEQVFATFAPEVVFHAAAHKHLPLLEMHPSEAVKTNVDGTLHVVRSAMDHGSERFIFISSDKAANPSSVLGGIKRLGELIVQSVDKTAPTTFASVRFGNVLASRGSVTEIFEQQIISGGPITVTHPEAKRYFMTIEEACHLVIQAGAFASGGEVFVLDMGESVLIVELARRMARLAAPERDIPITFTGLRPGEKLSEDLFFEDERPLASGHPKILRAQWDASESSDFWVEVQRLSDAAAGNDDAQVVTILGRLISGFADARKRLAEDRISDVPA